MMILAFQPWFKAKVLDEWSAISMGRVGHNPGRRGDRLGSNAACSVMGRVMSKIMSESMLLDQVEPDSWSYNRLAILLCGRILSIRYPC